MWGIREGIGGIRRDQAGYIILTRFGFRFLHQISVLFSVEEEQDKQEEKQQEALPAEEQEQEQQQEEQQEQGAQDREREP